MGSGLGLLSLDQNPAPVKLSHVQRLRFRQADRSLDSAECVRLDDWWRTYQAAHPHFHNGPVIACRRVVHEAEGSLVVEWYRTDYAHFLVREAPELGIAPAHTIFSAVALTTREGGLLVGRMAEDTASPNRLQFPGGGVVMPEGESLTPEVCLHAALEELEEEVGLQLPEEQIVLWRLKTGGASGDLGLFYRIVEPVDEVVVTRAFEALQEREQRAGIASELSEIVFLWPLE